MSNEDGVGYGRPPKQHQFKKGQSGNPKGRPRGHKSFVALLEEALSQPVSVQESGTRKTMKKVEAGAKQFANKVASGDYRALKLLLDLRDVLERANPSASFGPSVEDPLTRLQKRLNQLNERLRTSTEELPPNESGLAA